MGRKNGNVRRSNDKGRLARRQRGERPGPKGIGAIPHGVELDKMVLPDGQCMFRTTRPKARFATEEKAAEALRQAQKLRAQRGSTHVEKRYYACPQGGCGGFHLTSREQFDERVSQFRHQQYLDQTKNARRAQIQEEHRRAQ
jgi:hypothetical protein